MIVKDNLVVVEIINVQNKITKNSEITVLCKRYACKVGHVSVTIRKIQFCLRKKM